ncbi:MAG: hypothetical protein ACE15B_03670 [Bryobacteraceae bacterium]
MTRREALLAAAAPAVAPAGMPQVDFGKHKVGRLMVGGNPVSGHSHVDGKLSRDMIEYFTAANVKKMLRACEQAGINVWQSRADRHIMRLLTEYRGEGGRIQWIAQTASELADVPRNIRDAAALGAIGVYHHGTSTDALWAAGKIEEVRERIKVMRDAGVRAGLGTHIPEVIDYVEAKNWDVDFYMTCLYNISRSKEEASKLAGKPVEGEFFWDPDREKMLERVRTTRRQCLIFKVYGASRKCDSPEQMSAAMNQVFQYAKPSDCVVVGMFPKYKEQVAENCRYVVQSLA